MGQARALLRRLTQFLGDEAQAASELRWMTEKLEELRIMRVGRINKKQGTVSLIDVIGKRLGHYSDATSAAVERLDRQERKRLAAMVADRVERARPLQYILGTQPFCGMELLVRAPTLIPRTETEELARRVATGPNGIVARYSATKTTSPGVLPPLHVLDLCSGSGCLGLGIARLAQSEGAAVEVTGVDLSSAAVRLSRVNARREGLEAHARFVNGDVFDEAGLVRIAASPGGDSMAVFDVVVSNPPYIRPDEYVRLDASVRDWEDRRALVGQRDCGGIGTGDGLEFYPQLGRLAWRFVLEPRGGIGGWLMHAARQGWTGSRLLLLAAEVHEAQANEAGTAVVDAVNERAASHEAQAAGTSNCDGCVDGKDISLGYEVLQDHFGRDRHILVYAKTGTTNWLA
ncbi:HemK methyltransferase member 1 [Cladochytrium tenue]|nr:HemK methyltransferase member 1 [Cladochytrium tenue]